MKLTEELLLKYADGLLSPSEAAEVEQLLRNDEIAAERLRLIQLSGAALAAERDNLSDPGGEDPLTEYVRSADGSADAGSVPPHRHDTRSSIWWRRGIAASLALVFGLGAGYLLGQFGARPEAGGIAGEPTWLVRVVDYHTLYVPETVTTSLADEKEIAALQRKFTDTLGKPVTIPRLDDENLQFRRGQILKFEDQPIIQLAYLPTTGGKPVALCLKASPGEDTKPTYTKLRDLGVVRWRHNGVTYVLVGDRDEKKLLADAGLAVKQIAKS